MTDFPDLKFKALVQFPAALRGGIGISIDQSNGVYTISSSSTIINPAVAVPLVENGTGAVGVSVKYARDNYTTVLTDAQKHLLHPSADTTARTFTIAANASVAYPIGTMITFVNQNAAGIVTIAITSDTMRLAGAGTTGNRTLAANGICTVLKITTTEWIVSGTGLT
jgi:hypothetical protein